MEVLNKEQGNKLKESLEVPLFQLVDLSGEMAVDLQKKHINKSFERFTSSIVYLKEKPELREKLLADDQLKAEFLILEKEDVDLVREDGYKLRLNSLAKKVESIVSPQEFQQIYGKHIFLERRRVVSRKILNSVKPEVGKVFLNDVETLNMKRQKKEISEEEYFSSLDSVYSKAVEDSHDEELKKKWKNYKTEEDNYSFVPSSVAILSPSGNSQEKPLDKKEDLDLAVSQVRDLGISVDSYENSTAKVYFPNFSVDVSVFKNEETNELVYYLNDEFVEKPLSVKGENFLNALDARHLDMFLSDKIGLNLRGTDSVLEISDDQIVSLGEKLIGKGSDRNYRIEGEDKEILSTVAKILILPDPKYLTLAKKIEVINDFLNTEDRLFALKKRIPTASSVGELLG